MTCGIAELMFLYFTYVPCTKKNIKNLMGLGQEVQAEFGDFRYIVFQDMNAIPLHANRLPADMDTNSRSYLK